jgi:Ran GTPase-activating protein (RanGAP) involved in mRNA processing and transport
MRAKSMHEAITLVSTGTQEVELGTVSGTPEQFDTLCTCIADSNRLQTLSLINIGITSSDADALANAVEKSTSLRRLDLRSNTLRTEGCKKLAAAIAKSTRIQELLLSSNNINDEGVNDLVPIIPQLHTMELRNNNITSKGIKSLINAIGPKLKVVDLANNKIDNEAAESLAKALGKFDSLEKLDLSDNPKIRDEGVLAFLEILRKSKSMRVLHLQGITLSPETSEKIIDALLDNPRAIKVEVSGNEELKQKLEEVYAYKSAIEQGQAATLALQGSMPQDPRNRATNPVGIRVAKDGDHAIMSRVAALLAPQGPEVPDWIAEKMRAKGARKRHTP